MSIAGLFVLLIFTLLLIPRIASASNKRVITVSVDGVPLTISSEANSVNEALEEAGVEVFENDLVEPEQDSEITTAKFSINVYRARPVTVIDGKKQYNVMSPHKSARSIAISAGI